MKLLGATCLAAAALLVAGCSRVERAQFAPAIERITSSTPQWVPRGDAASRLWSSEQRFYRERGNLPAWIDGDRPTPQLDALLDALGDADVHGLEARGATLDALRAARAQAKRRFRRSAFEEAEIPELDAKLTYAFLAYAADLLGTGASPRTIDKNWLGAPAKADLGAVLKDAVDRNRVADALDDLAPQHPQYKGLVAALKRARDQSAEAVAPASAKSSGEPSEIEQIRMNMQRWRWLPRDLGERHIFVNVPAYEMQVVERGKPVLSMRVIVGKPDWPTPLFSDEMTYVVFSPSWNIPDKILRDETLPRVARDPDYLTRNNIEVVATSGRGDDLIDPSSIDWSDPDEVSGVRLRQAPGPDNALGAVKFIFPNHFNVYLHDTPNDRLFNQPMRAMSHGCIRVEDPLALADYVLRDRSEWGHDRIVTAMNQRSEQSVTLKDRLPVHITYFTAWVQPDGSVAVLDDPYGMDRKQARALKGE